MTEFIARLKQRKLVQWALAYVAFSFALLQGVDIVAQRFAWPDQIEKLLILALAIGLLVIPAQAGIQCLCCRRTKSLDSGFRSQKPERPRNDDAERVHP